MARPIPLPDPVTIATFPSRGLALIGLINYGPIPGSSKDVFLNRYVDKMILNWGLPVAAEAVLPTFADK